MAKKIGACLYMESSAKKELGVSEIFEKAMSIVWPVGGAAKASGESGDGNGETPRKKKSGCTLL